jgi:hypothetical protein
MKVNGYSVLAFIGILLYFFAEYIPFVSFYRLEMVAGTLVVVGTILAGIKIIGEALAANRSSQRGGEQ